MTVRLATVKATGHRYLVQRLEFAANAKVHCWGELVSFKGLRSRHDTSKTFLREAVEVAEVTLTTGLLAELFEQMIAARRAAGHHIALSRSGKRATDYGKQ